MKKIPAGRISKPFGSAGELVATLYEAFPAKPDPEMPLYVVVDGLEVPFFLEKFDRRGRTSAVVQFADIDTPRRAAMLLGKEILLPGAASGGEPKTGLGELVGYTACFGGESRGTIEDFVDSALNPLFAVSLDGKEVLIPAVDAFIEKVDRRRREVHFSLPEGLLALNGQ